MENMAEQLEEQREKFSRPQNSQEALQTAIERWIEFEYGIWLQTQQNSIKHLGLWGTALRLVLIILAGTITAISDIDTIPRTVITVLGGVLTIFTGIEGYLKLADRKLTAENRNKELLAERDRLKHEWMVKVELETDTDKALEEAKKLLESGPKIVSDIINKYVSRAEGEKPTGPR